MPLGAREARIAAGLPDYVTFDACRHGGMTELGDVDATEAQIMAVSGHSSPDAARRYIKRTERQQLAAVRKRRAAIAAAKKEKDEKGDVDPANDPTHPHTDS
jgi:integrase